MHQKRTIDISGQKFGKLTVENMLPSRKERNKWRARCRCVCECGNRIDVDVDSIKRKDSRRVTSCGCERSKGEVDCELFLRKNKLKYRREASFTDLKSDKNYYVRFDFAVLNANNELLFLIEYQGTQHVYNEFFGKRTREVTDPLKRTYCKENNIPLVEVWYYDNVEQKLTEAIKLYANPVPSKTLRLEGATTIPFEEVDIA